MTLALDLFCQDIDNPDASHLDKEALDLSYPGSNYVHRDGEALKIQILDIDMKGIFPQSTKNSKQLIEEAMHELSIAERERVYQDIVGVKYQNGVPLTACPNNQGEDTSSLEFRQARLQDMKRELQRLRSGSSWSLQMAGIEMAERQNPAFVEDPEFRMRFLNCEYWDATKAAGRFIRYFDLKLELFGEAKLTKVITLNDLEPEDLKSMKQGFTQLLPARDNNGRAVFFSIYNGQVYASPESVARQYFYMTSTRDKAIDDCGVIFLTFKVASFKFANERSPLAFMVVQRVLIDLPVRYCAIHKFTEPEASGLSKIDNFMDAAVNLFRPAVRARIRIYKGSFTEWIYKIMTFGVPHHLIPATADYKVKTKNHLEWLSMRQRMEEFAASPASAMIETTDLPANTDVLLGKGKPIQAFCGNQRLAALVDDYLVEYHKSSKTGKTALTNEIVAKVRESGGKFLSKESGVWIAVSDDMARDKVSHMFRHQRQKGSKTAQELTGNCSAVRTHVALRDDKACNKRVRT